MSRLVVDTGFLVALYRRGDELHADALSFLRENRAQLATASPVIVEACYFLSRPAKIELLGWVAKGGITVFDISTESYPALAALLEKYRERDIDFTDAALVWLADALGERSILTVDERDFAAFRLRGRQRFEIVRWYK